MPPRRPPVTPVQLTSSSRRSKTPSRPLHLILSTIVLLCLPYSSSASAFAVPSASTMFPFATTSCRFANSRASRWIISKNMRYNSAEL
ncbi:hypothetical protein SISSUDRAFT_1044124 [Sistotremastrum suecicum HHB10207 ss-3]|uniref:Uncharacterized protein n=1 Tax=Sistotremastrum suecicum HHB10207 ss-3 TaxID=1314776 RepID=A0A166D783_9AGAM|nr:hypothetical protein SISSUDRAFT_1047454 [Sistotremastrum suecicum HHB10207 ss-3]KZT40594.1 hypothetical protein SISSUDRAFT_1044124 [Sistotremastrum suecicum HHB10207 ss-3]